MALGKSRPLYYALLLLPFLGVLSVPLYNRTQPTLLGFPFFYWYQLAWVPATVLILGIIYWRDRASFQETSEGTE